MTATAASATTTSSAEELLLLQVPTELSPTEYADLLQQIRHDFSTTELEQEWLDAARHNDMDVVRGILCVYPQFLYYQSRSGQHTALHMAAANGHVAMVDLLLTVEQHQQQQQTQNNNDDSKEKLCLTQIVNAAGNTALHWAAANGRAPVVQLLLSWRSSNSIDVLQKNQAGRSALTEGFASEDTTTIQYLLEHESASEEKLVATATRQDGTHNRSDDNDDNDNNSDPTTSSVTHALVFGSSSSGEEDGIQQPQQQRLQIRELVMARHADDSILGQARPEDDTTGLGIWASSLVMAQWMSDVFSTEKETISRTVTDKNSGDVDGNGEDTTTTTILELGAGCGVPGLVAAAAVSGHDSNQNSNEHYHKTTVYLTDFNPTVVANLKHNIDLNQSLWEGATTVVDCRALAMNWQDSSTWPNETRMDVVIGSDLIYQHDMVPLLLQTLQSLRPRRFYYAAPATGRQGQDEFLDGLVQQQQHKGTFVLVSRQPAPSRYTTTNPLQSQDDEECFVHFHELGVAQFVLYEFQWMEGDDGNTLTTGK